MRIQNGERRSPRITGRTPRLPACVTLAPQRCQALTLVELLVVVVLLGVAASLAAVRMDGFTQHGRLRAALARVEAAHGLARLEALGSGQPRRIAYAVGGTTCALERPGPVNDGWGWVAGSCLTFGYGVRIERVWVAGQLEATGPPDTGAVCVRSDGTSPSYAVVVSAGAGYAAAVIDGASGRCTWQFELSEETAHEPAVLLESTP